MDREKVRDLVAGSLYGLLIGDALGCPTEGLTVEQIHDLYGGDVTEMVEGEKWWRPAGLHSDDGQQALAILDALLEFPSTVADGFAARCVALLEEGPRGYRRFGLHRGTGANFRGTVMKLKQGAPFHEAAVVTAGNGAAMRVAPLALYHRADLDALKRAVIDVSLVTHRDPRGIAAAAAVAVVVARAARGDAVVERAPVLDFVRAVEDELVARLALDEVDSEFSSVLEDVLEKEHDDVTELLADVVRAAAAGADSPNVGALDGFCCTSVTSALALFFRALRTGLDFEDALVECINLGGDADTVGAMLGQMMGAVYGRSALPSSWMDALWARGVLEDRIDALVEGRTGFSPGFSLVELERPWTAALYEGQDARRHAGRADAGAPPRVATAQPKAEAPVVEEDAPVVEKETEVAKTPDIAGQLGLFAAPVAMPPVREEAKVEVEVAAPDAESDPRAVDLSRVVLTQGDITRVETDAIVNAANSALRGGGGVDGAIHRRGGPSIMDECKLIRAQQGGCRTGDAVVTSAGQLSAKHVIHAVGPRWRGGGRGEPELLERAYTSSLERAREVGDRKVAFPSISTGSYGYPMAPAATVALLSVGRYLARYPDAFDEVRFVLFEERALSSYRAALDELKDAWQGAVP